MANPRAAVDFTEVDGPFLTFLGPDERHRGD
jgi:hypothetical protein